MNLQETIAVVKNTALGKFRLNLSESSKKIILEFVDVFVECLDNKVSLDKAFKKTKSVELELIREIEAKLVLSISGDRGKTVKECLELINNYKNL